MAIKPKQVRRYGLTAKLLEKIIDSVLTDAPNLTFTDDTVTCYVDVTAPLIIGEDVILAESYIKAGWTDFLLVDQGPTPTGFSYAITLTSPGIGLYVDKDQTTGP